MEKGTEKMIREFEDVVPNDYHLQELDNHDIVIGILTEEEQKICTYIHYISDLLLERGERDEVANKMIFKINVYKEILFYLIRERLHYFKYDEKNLTIKKGFKVVLENSTIVLTKYRANYCEPSFDRYSRFGD